MEIRPGLDRFAHRRLPIAANPQLRLLCWNRRDDTVLDGEEALALYERNWRFLEADTLDGAERALIAVLCRRHGGGALTAA